MIFALLLIALVLLGSAAAAMLSRNLIHSALLLILSWAGIAGFYLWAGAEFAAFAQVLIYVGAISMVVLFAVLLTRQGPAAAMLVEPASRTRATAGITVALCVGAAISAAVLNSEFRPASGPPPAALVKQLGLELMHRHGAALLIVGIILTVALLGATVLAAGEPRRKPEDPA